MYVYMALGASIGGFLNCRRPILVVDAAYCKGNYKGIMLVAMSIDANKQVYPMAFELGDKEKDESWTWFMTRLRTTISAVNGLVFVDFCVE